MDLPQGPSNENDCRFQSPSPATTARGNAIQQSIANPTYTNPSPRVLPRLKRTVTEVDISTSLLHSSTAKRARIIRPVPSRPMSLVLPSENEPVAQPENSGAGATSDHKDTTDKGKKLQRTSSYYPGRGDGCGDSTRGLSPLDLNDHDTDVDEPIETEEDWMGDEPVVKPTQGAPSKFAEAVANERPLWQGLDYVAKSILADQIYQSSGAHISDPSGSASGSGQAVSQSVGGTPVHVPPPMPELTAGLSGIRGLTVRIDLGGPTHDARVSWALSGLAARIDLGGPTHDARVSWALRYLAVVALLPGSTSAVQPTMQESAGPMSPWPADTDLVFGLGSKKVMLTLQFPLVRAVLQDAFEYMRAYLVLTDAFPDTTDAISFARDSLITAAESHQSDAAIICERLQHDAKYLAHLLPVPRTQMSRIRAEVKERCGALCVPQIYTFGDATEIARRIQKQLINYNYTFPFAMIVGTLPEGLPRRTRPYRNDRIISIIRDLYFTGGSSSLATRFEDQFPTHQGPDGDFNQEVPISMVALVVTALYATLYEWRNGEQQVTEFSANTYLDVYLGHVNTLNHICANREGVYHLMMADIFSQARLMGSVTGKLAHQT
ncbi:hypothetical protein EDB83DRAFT_2321461 [Lactarius deliciosus]|nr:hypothetical protein EDB83DRAFT_2321461 [Lactarius deliciosus]